MISNAASMHITRTQWKNWRSGSKWNGRPLTSILSLASAAACLIACNCYERVVSTRYRTDTISIRFYLFSNLLTMANPRDFCPGLSIASFLRVLIGCKNLYIWVEWCTTAVEKWTGFTTVEPTVKSTLHRSLSVGLSDGKTIAMMVDWQWKRDGDRLKRKKKRKKDSI